MSENESFHEFFLKMAILNKKMATHSPLDDEYKKIKKYLEIIIPIFNRLTSTYSTSLTIEDLIKKNSNDTIKNDTIQQNDKIEDQSVYFGDEYQFFNESYGNTSPDK